VLLEHEEITMPPANEETIPPMDESQADHVEYPPHSVCCGTQTDLSFDDIAALEADNQQRVNHSESVQVRHGRKGFPDQDDFIRDNKVLRFYTGINSFTVLMAVFELVAVVIPETPLSKHSKFQTFTLI
jgi:hypothetical protein